MSRNLDLFAPAETGDTALHEQVRRMQSETLVAIDLLLAAGFDMKFLDDAAVESQRRDRAFAGGLVRCGPRKSFTTGKRPAAWEWGRKVRPDDRYDVRRINRELVFVAREPHRVAQLFSNLPKVPRQRRLMTPKEIDLAAALGRCRFSPASWDKRFANDMAGLALHLVAPTITEKQAEHLQRLAHRYRGQLAELPVVAPPLTW